MVRRAAGITLTASAIFLAMVAVLLNSSALFYMSTAIIATIIASRVQSYLSVRGLHFERHAPSEAKVGELVTVDLTVWSDRRIRRPLVYIVDGLPSRLVVADLTPSLPIAPAYDVPITTKYNFRPLRRGRYRWSALKVVGTDALGLVTTERKYDQSPVEMLVVPNPLPVDYETPPAPAFGISESETGQGRGAGIEPRGIREYVSGDSLRYVHWRSSARAGKLLVKEFATGSFAYTAFVFQRTHGSEVGVGATTTLEQMCANAAYMAERMIKQGGEISFPTIGQTFGTFSYKDHTQEVLSMLATVEADVSMSIAEEVRLACKNMPAGGLLYTFVALADDGLPQQVRQCLAQGVQVVAMIYDAAAYLPARAKLPIPSAATPSFVEALRQSGAVVTVVPKPEVL